MYKLVLNFDPVAVINTVLKAAYFTATISVSLVFTLACSVHSTEAALVILIISMGLMWVVYEMVWGER